MDIWELRGKNVHSGTNSIFKEVFLIPVIYVPMVIDGSYRLSIHMFLQIINMHM